MRIVSVRALSGPNVYSHRAMLVTLLDLEDLTERESCQVPGFVERLLALLPGLHEHTCGPDYPGGFVERLEGGTYFGHVVGHVAIELAGLIGLRGNHGKTRNAGALNLYHVAVECENEAGVRNLLETAVELVEALVRGETFDPEPRFAEARRLEARTRLGPSTRAVVEAGPRRGIPHARRNDESLVQLGWGRHRRLTQAAMTDRTSGVGVEVASDKQLTKALLGRAAIPVPRGLVVRSVDEALAAWAQIGGPVVVKPLDARQGKGVSLNLTTKAEVRAAFAEAARFAGRVLIEEQVAGRDYRALVVAGRLVAASERTPPQVVGDGVHTIAELIEIESRDPRRDEGHDNVLTRIEPDAIRLAHLARPGLALDTVPAAGTVVTLRESANLSTGSIVADVTDRVHPSVRCLCERAAGVLGLDIAGINLVLEDIARPITEQRGGVIETARGGMSGVAWPGAGRTWRSSPTSSWTTSARTASRASRTSPTSRRWLRSGCARAARSCSMPTTVTPPRWPRTAS